MVVPLSATLFFTNEPHFSQNLKMLRYRWPADLKASSDLGNAEFALAEIDQNLATDRVR